MRVSHFVTLLSGGVGIESVSPTLLDTPADATYPSNVYARSVWALRAWAGYLFAGTGDSAHNVTAPPIWNTTDGSTWSDTDGVTFADHQIDRFVLTGGVLWIPGHDPTSGTLGNLYSHVSANTWNKSTPATLSACAHVYDMLHDGTYLWAAVGASSGSNSIRRSSDNGATWSGYAAPGSGMDVTPTRAWTFFTIDGTLYASTNYAYYTSPPAWSAYNDPWVNTVKWNGSAWVTSGVQFAPNDTLQVQYTEVEPEVFEISSVGRIAKAVTFGSRVFYIVGQTVTDHDFSPTNLYSVTAALTPTRLTFMGGAKVHDLLVHNNACYALCNELVGDTYTTTVYVTSDGTNWTGALTFRHSDTYTYARCMQFFGGELYLGYACYYDAEGAGAGKIVRTSSQVIILFGGGVTATAPTITNTTLDAATYGAAYSDFVEATGTAPITYAVTSGSLPTGLSLNASTGEISGTLTVPSTEQTVTSTTANFTITATNAGGSDDQAYTLTLNHTFASYATMLANASIARGWWRNAITSGTSVPNAGSVGSALDGTLSIGGGAIAQTGQLGANQAIDFDGATSSGTVINCGNNAGVQGLEEFILFALCKPDTAGGSNAGRIIEKGGEWSLRFSNATRAITSTVFSTGNGSSASTTAVSNAAWGTVAMKYTHAGDKTPRMYINAAEVTYSSAPTAATGTRTSNTNAVTIGNVTGRTVAFDGLIDEVLVLASVNVTHITNLNTLSGV